MFEEVIFLPLMDTSRSSAALTLKGDQQPQLGGTGDPSPNSVSCGFGIVLGSESSVRQSFEKLVEDKVSMLFFFNEKGNTQGNLKEEAEK